MIGALQQRGRAMTLFFFFFKREGPRRFSRRLLYKIWKKFNGGLQAENFDFQKSASLFHWRWLTVRVCTSFFFFLWGQASPPSIRRRGGFCLYIHLFVPVFPFFCKLAAPSWNDWCFAAALEGHDLFFFF